MAVNAYRVIAKGFPSSGGIYPATTSAKAKYKAFRAAKDAGYDVPFSELKACRAYEFDAIVTELPLGGASWEHANFLLQERMG